MPVGLVCQLNYGLSGCLQYQNTLGTSSIVPFSHSCVALRIGQRVTFALRELSSGNEAADIEVQSDAAPTSSSKAHWNPWRFKNKRRDTREEVLQEFGQIWQRWFSRAASDVGPCRRAAQELFEQWQPPCVLDLLHLSAPCFSIPGTGRAARVKIGYPNTWMVNSLWSSRPLFLTCAKRVMHGNPLRKLVTSAN